MKDIKKEKMESSSKRPRKSERKSNKKTKVTHVTIGENLEAVLPKTPLEVLEQKIDFPKTEKNENDAYYEWPYNPDLLTLLLRYQAHHESAVKCKTDTAALSYRPHINNKAFEGWVVWKAVDNAVRSLLIQAKENPEKAVEIGKQISEMREGLEADEEKLKEVQDFFRFMPTEVMIAAIFDYVYLGNIFFNFLFDEEGEVSGVRHLYARTMRVGLKKGYMQVMDGRVKKKFPSKRIKHIKQYGPESSIYGSPSYLGSQNSNLLCTAYDQLFLRFVENGAHLGHLFLFNFDFDDRDKEGKSAKEDKIKQDIVAAQGIGNGKNWYFNLGGLIDEQGKPVKVEEVVKIVPLGELIAKMNMDVKASEYLRNNIVSAHRIPPEIMAVVVENKNAGDLDKIVTLYNMNTVQPIQRAVKEAVNERLPPDRWIDFDPYMVGG